jgi:thiamine biosynthesis lipoprotein
MAGDDDLMHQNPASAPELASAPSRAMSRHPTAGAEVTVAVEAMGTRFEVILRPAAGHGRAFLQACAEEAIAEIERWHRLLNAFAPDSIISKVNREAASRAVPVDAETFALFARCRDLWHDTHGAFDITLGAMMRAQGFRDVGSSPHTPAAHGMRLVELNDRDRTVRFLAPGVLLDLGGIAKGWALDHAAALLRAHGVFNALLHGGTSSVVAIGPPRDQSPWSIALREPTIANFENDSASSQSPSHRIVSLRDRALSVSSPHGRTVERDGVHVGHIIDPRTGAPALTRLASVTPAQAGIQRSQSAAGVSLAAVIAESATVAEAWSTALIVLGSRPDNLDASIETIFFPTSCVDLPAADHAASVG